MRLGNRTYRVLGKLELPKYFLKLHETAPTVLGYIADVKNSQEKPKTK